MRDADRLAWFVATAPGGGAHETELIEKLQWNIRRFDRAKWMAWRLRLIDLCWGPGFYLVRPPDPALPPAASPPPSRKGT